MSDSTGYASVEAKVRALRSLRLPPDDERNLRFLWNEFEAACGVRSTLGAQLAQLAVGARIEGGAALCGSDVTYQPERWLFGDAKRWGVTREGVARTRATLGRLAATPRGARHVTVLYRAYGPPDPSAPYLALGRELAPLACLTATTSLLAARATTRLRLELKCPDGKGPVVDEKEAFRAFLAKPRNPERMHIVDIVRVEAEQLLIRASQTYASEHSR